MSPFLRAYFSRLGWTGEPDVSIDTLRELHLQHNSAIPFENLDVLLPREIHLDDRALEEKLITARRGGYCFEQNGLLERVLREIGFNVRSLLGRVVLANPPQMPPPEAPSCMMTSSFSYGVIRRPAEVWQVVQPSCSPMSSSTE